MSVMFYHVKEKDKFIPFWFAFGAKNGKTQAWPVPSVLIGRRERIEKVLTSLNRKDLDAHLICCLPE